MKHDIPIYQRHFIRFRLLLYNVHIIITTGTLLNGITTEQKSWEYIKTHKIADFGIA